MADTTDVDVAAAVGACTLAAAKVQTALNTIAENHHSVSRYRVQMQNAALAVTNKVDRGRPVAPQG